MTKLTKHKAAQLLILCRDFIVSEILIEDKKAQLEINQLFEQLIELVDDKG